MSWIGRNLLSRLIPNVAVNDLQQVAPEMLTCFELRFAKFWLDTGAYFSGVWSKFMTKDDGMSCSSTNLMIWWWYKRSASFFAPSGMTGLLVVADRLRNPIRWNKLFGQDVFSRSSTFRFLSSHFAIRACAIATATTVFTTSPFLRITCRLLHNIFVDLQS